MSPLRYHTLASCVSYLHKLLSHPPKFMIGYCQILSGRLTVQNFFSCPLTCNCRSENACQDFTTRLRKLADQWRAATSCLRCSAAAAAARLAHAASAALQLCCLCRRCTARKAACSACRMRMYPSHALSVCWSLLILLLPGSHQDDYLTPTEQQHSCFRCNVKQRLALRQTMSNDPTKMISQAGHHVLGILHQRLPVPQA